MVKGSGEIGKMDGLFYKCFTKRCVPKNGRNVNGISWKVIGYGGLWMISDWKKFKTGLRLSASRSGLSHPPSVNRTGRDRTRTRPSANF